MTTERPAIPGPQRRSHWMNQIAGHAAMRPDATAFRCRGVATTWVVDRRRDVIISGGEDVCCAEVEDVLAAHPEILDVVVYGRPDEEQGEVPVAAVVLTPGATLELHSLRHFLDQRLARFKQPRALVPVLALPRSAGGEAR